MLDLTLSPSRRLACALIAAHALAALSLWLTDLPRWAPLVGTIVLGAAGLHYVRRYARLLSPRSVVSLRLARDCQIELGTRGGQLVVGVIAPGSFVTPHLTVLAFVPEGRRVARHVVIAPDMLSAADFRALRVHLRWRCGAGARGARV